VTTEFLNVDKSWIWIYLRAYNFVPSFIPALSAHYQLPMDVMLSGGRIVNPSGLDARATGYPPFVRGVRHNAVQLNGRDNHVRVSGPAHRHECFGDLDKCPLGDSL